MHENIFTTRSGATNPDRSSACLYVLLFSRLICLVSVCKPNIGHWFVSGYKWLELRAIRDSSLRCSPKDLAPAEAKHPTWLVLSVRRFGIHRWRHLCLCGRWKNYKQETKVPFTTTVTGALLWNHISFLCALSSQTERTTSPLPVEPKQKKTRRDRSNRLVTEHEFSCLRLLTGFLVFPTHDQSMAISGSVPNISYTS